MNERFEWKDNLTSAEWDNILIASGGHPLQSAQWGNARKFSDKKGNTCWVALKNGVPIFLARLEERCILGFLRIAWLPKGPIVLDLVYEEQVQAEFLERLKHKGFSICATNPWKEISLQQANKTSCYTIWIDLTIGKEKLWANLHKQFRYDVRRSKKFDVIIEKSRRDEDIHAFYELCKSLSYKKGFELCTSVALMSQLLHNDNQDQVESYLFIARQNGKFCGGAFVIRCGENIHYMWGAIDRAFAHFSIGEAIQWEIIEWALSKNCKKYDLEGIDPRKETGVNYFKKKLGGDLIAYSGMQVYPLHTRGKILSIFLKIYLRLLPSLRDYKKYLPMNG